VLLECLFFVDFIELTEENLKSCKINIYDQVFHYLYRSSPGKCMYI